MLEVKNIWRHNAKTFYDRKTERQHSLVWRYFIFVVVSIIFAITFGRRSDNVYMGLITAQAILVGFSFNIMMFMASNKKIIVVDKAIIENKLKADRVNKLGNEIFYNLSYFNLVALTSVVMSIVMLFGPSDVLFLSDVSGFAFITLRMIWAVVGLLALFILYFSSVESLATFIRIIQRTTYYFEQRVHLEAPASQAS